MKHLFFLTFLAILSLTSCDKNSSDLELDEANLFGEWRSQLLTIDGVNVEEFLGDGFISGSIMSLQDENRFFVFDYNSGSWGLMDNVLDLQYNDGSTFRRYNIVELRENQFVAEVTLTPRNFYYTLEGIDEGEAFVLRELFVRQ